jgi:hypothetical protein
LIFFPLVFLLSRGQHSIQFLLLLFQTLAFGGLKLEQMLALCQFELNFLAELSVSEYFFFLLLCFVMQ